MTIRRSIAFAMALLFVVTVKAEGNAVDKTTLKPKTTTTPATTTTASTTSAPTTTASPVTTTALPPTTTPLPPPTTAKWAYHDPSNNKSCVIVQMALQFNVSYEDKDMKNKSALFDLPINTTHVVEGSCANETQFLKLQWPIVGNLTNNLTIHFNQNSTSEEFSLTAIELAVIQDEQYFPGSNEVNGTIVAHFSGMMFVTPLKMSYRCAKLQDITLVNTGHRNTTLAIRDMQLQAFHDVKGNTFGNANDCEHVDVPDIVPIAVGCALGALVFIVLIAYLVGRRRSLARGYLSM